MAFGLREIGRRSYRRTAGLRLALTPFSNAVPDRLIVAPTDLHSVDPFVADEIAQGRFPLAGTLLDTEGRSPFDVDLPTPAFAERLHSFAWLRHIRADRTAEACARARTITATWIAGYGRRPRGIAWRPHVVAERVIAWLSHSTIVLQGAEAGFYRRFMRSLAYQVRYLRRLVRGLPREEARLRIRIALAMASVAMPTRNAYIRREGSRLDRELERQILPDGGHVSRNPRAILDLLLDLLPLRQTYINLGHDIPSKLIPAIDRMYPALRFFRHQDGDLALFNGATSTSASELISVLRYDETAGKPFKSLPHMNYHRLAAGGTVLLIDTGKSLSPELSQRAHAGCLAFEMSAGRHRFIVNSGAPKFAPREYRQLARSTAAHSAVTLNDTSSSRVVRSRVCSTSILAGIEEVEAERWEDAYGNDWLRGIHDGYRRIFGYLHEREIGLSSQGNKIKGRDRLFRPEEAGGPADPVQATARFHVHPAITLSEQDGETVLLVAPDGEAWQFSAPGLPVVIEEDLFFADASGVRPSQQIVIAFSVPDVCDIRWMLRRLE
ncbi:heparinase II/III family protein [Pseudorhizobium endolithicum]|nr:heparinase II/III family protein [Pseudorhizobium endolithicum]